MNEKALQRKVLRKLRELGGVWVNQSPGPWDKQGCADVLGCLRGRFVAIELKHPEKYQTHEALYAALTPAQEAFLVSVAQNGGVALVTNGWEGVEQVLRNNGLLESVGAKG
jgi:Holliday junction resolvase